MRIVCTLISAIGLNILLFAAGFYEIPISRITNNYPAQCTPTILFTSIAKNDENIPGRQLLIDRFGCTEEFLSRILLNGQYNTKPYSELEARANWLQQRLNLTERDLKKIIRKYPYILSMKTETYLKKLEYLESRLELKDAKLLRSVIQKNPRILGFSIEDNMEPKLSYLQKRLHMNETKIGKLVLKGPSILTMKVDNIEPKITWLQQRLNFTDTEVSKIIWRMPYLFHYSIIDNIEPHLEWLQNRLELSNDQTKKIIQGCPHILYFSIENKMEPTLKWLNDSLLLQNKSDLVSVITKMPSLLSYSIEKNLEPTLDFYMEALADEAVAMDMLKRDPICFGYSLEKRLKPRLDSAKGGGLLITKDVVYTLAKYSEPEWMSYLRRAKE